MKTPGKTYWSGLLSAETQAAFEARLQHEIPVVYQVAQSLAEDEEAARHLTEKTLQEALKWRSWLEGRPLKPWLLATLRECHRMEEDAIPVAPDACAGAPRSPYEREVAQISEQIP